MRAFGKHITGAFHVCGPADDLLLRVQVTDGVCECCGEPVKVIRLGLGLIEFDVFVQNGH